MVKAPFLCIRPSSPRPPTAAGWGKRWRWAGLGALLTLWTTLATAGEPAWPRDPVLSTLLIRQMVTDPTGLRWVATDKGVYRYDGYEVVSLNDLTRASPRLPVDLTYALALDATGQLWIGAKSGLYRFGPATGTLVRVPLPLAADEPPMVYGLFQHPRTGRLWVAAGRAVGVLVSLPSQPPRFLVARLPHAATSFVADAGPGVWFYNDLGEQAHLAGDGRLRQLLRVPEALFPVPNSRPARFVTDQGVLEVDSTGARHWVGRWPAPLASHHGLPAFAPDSTCELLSSRQLLRLSGLHGAHPVVHATAVGLGTPGPGNWQRYCLERDAYGTVWGYSQLRRGCFKQRDVRMAIEPVLLANGQPAASARAIRRLPDGRLLVSTYDGYLTQAADSPRAPLRPLELWWAGAQQKAVGGIAMGLVPVQGGRRVVVADEGRSFLLLDPARNRVEAQLCPAGSCQLPACAVLEDQAGRIWAGATPGLYRLDLKSKKLTRYGDDVPGWPLHTVEVRGLAEDRANGALWLATAAGLYWYHPLRHTLRAFRQDVAGTYHLPTNALQAVAAAGPGRVWAATLDQGLLLVDLHRGLLRHLTPASGLPSATVGTVLCDPAGTVWAGTYAGLVRYTPATGQLAVYREAEGLDSPELNRRSLFRDPDGTLWLGGVGGVYRLRPARAGGAQAGAAPRLLAVAVGTSATGAEPVLRQLLPGRVADLALSAGAQASVVVQLALTDYFDAERVRYAYRLRVPAGLPTTGWLPTTRLLVLRGLAPGTYEVEVRAETTWGPPPANYLRLPLHVAAVWWQHPVAWLLGTGLMTVFLSGLYSLRLGRLRREFQMRAELAANLHDEVGALLTRVTLLAEILREEHEPAGPVAAAALGDATFDRLLFNSRAAVQIMRDVVWGIDSRADSVGALLDRMRDHLDQTAALASIRPRFRAEGLRDQLALNPALRQHLYLLFKEALTNAVRHGVAVTEVEVRLAREGAAGLVLEISDNGQYAAPDRTPMGTGLRNMAQRAAAMGGVLYTGPRPDGQPGYCVRVQAPLKGRR